MTNPSAGQSTPWVKWIGLSANNQTIDATDVNLTSRNVFTVNTYWPSGVSGYDLPWYNMLASNGSYVGGSKDGTGRLLATYDLANAGSFGRGWDDYKASRFLLGLYPWGERESWLDRIRTVSMYAAYCESAYSNNGTNIVQWLFGPSPNFSCYASGDVDFFVVN